MSATTPILPAVIDLVRKAGAAVMDVYAGAIETQAKADLSPLTEADLKSHRILLDGLAKILPGVPILSEEGVDLDYATRRKWKLFWLVDPLDGTKEFIKRNGEFTINVALVDGQSPILGVVMVPAQAKIYSAARGAGATVIEGGQPPRPIHTANPAPGETLKLVSSRSHSSLEFLDYVEKMKSEHPQVDVRPVGSALKFCLVAEGIAHLYPRLGTTMEWDVAAAHVVVKEAGKNIYRFDDGEELTYNKANLQNPWFIVR